MRISEAIKKAMLKPLEEQILSEVGELETSLPATVQAALLNAGKIDDPYYADNFERIQWIPRIPWEYKFKVSPKGVKNKLVFHGVDYRCEVYVNGKLSAEHEGMFSRFSVDLPEGESEVLVKVLPNLEDERPLITPPTWGFKKNMRFPMSYGWDYAPKIITIGIWDTVELIQTGGAFVDDIFARGLLNGEVFVSANVEVPEPGEYTVKISVLDEESVLEEREFRISSGGTFRWKLRVSEFEPWIPWDFGEPKTYEIEISVLRNGDTLDIARQKFGFVEVKKKGINLLINGVKIFVRGVNWVPADSLLRLSDERYEKLLKLVREANANLIRVWGGGLRERRKFYELADSLGLMVWQEFPFACERIELSDRMLKLVEREGRGIVKYIRSHPSVVLFSGGNEVPYRSHKVVFDILERVVKEEHGFVPFHPVSPYNGDMHSWYVWHGYTTVYAYRLDPSPMISEFGLQAIPNEDTLRAFLPEVWPPNELWVKHHAELTKHYYYAYVKDIMKQFYLLILQMISFLTVWLKIDVQKALNLLFTKKITKKISKNVRDLRSFILRSQFAQALGLKIGIEHFRSEKDIRSGCALWQFNDPWPNISWSIVDYFGRKKLSYHFVRLSYEPLQALLKPTGVLRRKIEVIIVNDHPRDISGELVVYRDRKAILTTNFSVPANSKVKVGELPFRASYYKTVLRAKGKEIVNIYPPQFFGMMMLADRLIVDSFIKGTHAFYQS